MEGNFDFVTHEPPFTFEDSVNTMTAYPSFLFCLKMLRCSERPRRYEWVLRKQVKDLGLGALASGRKMVCVHARILFTLKKMAGSTREET